MTLKLFDEPDYRPDLGQYHTPPKLAAKVAEVHRHVLAQAVVLEPAAGGGALVRASLDVGARHVVAVEIDPAWCARLRERFAVEVDSGTVSVVEASFLDLDPLDQRIHPFGLGPRRATFSNPPYNDGLDTAFLEALVSHARVVEMARLPSRVPNVAVLNLSALSGAERHERVWSRTHLDHLSVLSRRPAFGCAEGGSGSKDVAVVRFSGLPGLRQSTYVDWWPESWS